MEDIDEKYIEILDAIKILKLENEFFEIHDYELLKTIQDIFVIGNPRVWWLSLKFVPAKLSGQNEFEYIEISKYFDQDSICYFITELDEIHVFQSKIKFIGEVIGECSFFEYYVVDDKKEKFVCETDHGDLLYIDLNNPNLVPRQTEADSSLIDKAKNSGCK